MKQISVILSSSTGFRNTGMFSVDYSAYVFFKSNFPEHKIKFYVFHLSDKSDYPYDHLVPYETYNKVSFDDIPKIHKSDLIVYWSDFFHTRHFFEGYMTNYVFDKESLSADHDLFFKLFFLEGADDSVFEKTVVFGNSLMFLGGSDIWSNSLHSTALRNLYSKIRIAMPRDCVSLCNIDNPCFNSDQGCDPAFLLLPSRSPRCAGKIGLFIGRRTEIKIRDVIKIILFAKYTKKKIEWIPWMENTESLFNRAISNPRQAKNLLIHITLSAIFKRKSTRPALNIDRLGQYELIITDTYHLAINSIKDNTPVFCIGDDSIIYGKDELDLHDRKKEVLFSMMGAEDCYGDVSFGKLFSASRKHKYREYKAATDKIKSKLINICSKIIGDSNASI